MQRALLGKGTESKLLNFGKLIGGAASGAVLMPWATARTWVWGRDCFRIPLTSIDLEAAASAAAGDGTVTIH